MGLSLTFTPLIPLWLLVILAIVAAVAAAVLLVARARGAWWRAAALAALVLALANPAGTLEDREPLNAVVAVVIDRSASQSLGGREQQAETARRLVAERIGRIPGLEVRVVEAAESTAETDGTRLFDALSNSLSDVPPDRVAGAIMITDGRVHDVPTDARLLGFEAPVHVLVTGRADELDRRVVLTQTPRFGIVGQRQVVGFRVEDKGLAAGRVATVTIRRDGEQIEQRQIATGQTVTVEVEVTHGGANLVEVEASALAGELTTLNNRAVVSIEGVREKLRVLLVSGEPHAGERTWRNLLKSDANVDLVHFTILRPPEKQDGTPINELSLIAFPTRELFQVKIGEFDLIIFDRYARQGVLPLIYFDNIARYVRDGGAVLIAAGPDYASSSSLWRTPLEPILPAEPTGRLTEGGFHARLTDPGKRHPVTRGLDGANADPPRWSRFFRLVDTRNPEGTTVMRGPEDKPLLVLSREGEGRVALMLTDHIWLWARGYEGGGPHLDLLRRLAHWLMKEPELEEEALKLRPAGGVLTVERRTMAAEVAPVTVTSPSGRTTALQLTETEPGLFRATVPINEVGLWRAADGTLTALVNVGPVNPREFTEVTSTLEVLGPVVAATGGAIQRLVQPSFSDANRLDVPRIVPVRAGDAYRGEGWIGLRLRDASTVRGIGVLPLLSGIIGLFLMVGLLALTWAREGR